MVKELQPYGTEVTISDPLANPAEVKHEYGLLAIMSLEPALPSEGQKYDAIVLTVAHKEFLNMDLDSLKSKGSVVYDVKGVLDNAGGKL